MYGHKKTVVVSTQCIQIPVLPDFSCNASMSLNFLVVWKMSRQTNYLTIVVKCITDIYCMFPLGYFLITWVALTTVIITSKLNQHIIFVIDLILAKLLTFSSTLLYFVVSANYYILTDMLTS